MARLVIADDGVGQPEGAVDGEVPGSMGKTLIDAFTRQLGGEITVSGPPGTVSTLVFPLEGGEPQRPSPGPQSAAALAAGSPEP